MQAISHEAGEIVYLSVPMKRMIYYLDAILPERVYYLNYSGRFVSNYRDSTEMMHCTASGKAMLAHDVQGRPGGVSEQAAGRPAHRTR